MLVGVVLLAAAWFVEMSTLPSVFLVVGVAEPDGGPGAVAAAAGLPHAPVRIQQPLARRLESDSIRSALTLSLEFTFISCLR